jgi:hypothetical protein
MAVCRSSRGIPQGIYLHAKRLYLAGKTVAQISEETGIKERQLWLLINVGNNKRGRKGTSWREMKERVDALIKQAKCTTVEETVAKIREAKSLTVGRIHEVLLKMAGDGGELSVDELGVMMKVLKELDTIERLEDGKPTAHVLSKRVTVSEVMQAIEDLNTVNDGQELEH